MINPGILVSFWMTFCVVTWMLGITLEPTETSKRESSTTVVIFGPDFEQACNNKKTDESNSNGFLKSINLNWTVNNYVIFIYFKSSCKIRQNTKKQYIKITIPTIITDQNVFK